MRFCSSYKSKLRQTEATSGFTLATAKNKLTVLSVQADHFSLEVRMEKRSGATCKANTLTLCPTCQP